MYCLLPSQIRGEPQIYKISLEYYHCVLILSQSVRIRNYSGPNAGKLGPEQLRMRTLFMQCILLEH